MQKHSIDLRLKRAYEPPASDDGYRILVDRLWPRGISKVEAKLDLWLKEIAPSTELRQWFQHDPLKWPEFQRRYVEELGHCPDALACLMEHLHQGRVTLVYGAKDSVHNDAQVLASYLEAHWKGKP